MYKKHILALIILTLLTSCGQISDKDLIKAAYNGKTEVIEKAIDSGADINLRSTKENINILSYAAGAGHAQTVLMLLRKGANTNLTDNNGWTALHFAASKQHIDSINMLAKFKADMNIQTNDGWTALMYAAFAGSQDTVINLIQNGADASIAMENGMDALAIAQEKGFKNLILVLQTAKNMKK